MNRGQSSRLSDIHCQGWLTYQPPITERRSHATNVAPAKRRMKRRRGLTFLPFFLRFAAVQRFSRIFLVQGDGIFLRLWYTKEKFL